MFVQVRVYRMATTGTKGVSNMAQLPINFTPSYSVSPHMSPSVSEDDITPQLETQTVGHPYMMGKVRMRRKEGTEHVGENGNIPDHQPNIQMMSLKIELEKAKTELNRRTVMFSNHYSSMVDKWQHEKTKREVAENVAVEKARDNMVLQRTHFSLQQRAKKSTEGILPPPVPKETQESEEKDGGEGTEGEEPISLTGSEDKDLIGLTGSEDKDLIGLTGSEDKDLIGLTEENQKLTLEIQDLKETVKHLEGQISESEAINDEQELEVNELRAKLTEMELELKQSKSYMMSAQQQYRNLAGRLQHEKGKREVAENVAVNKARELEVQKRTSVMVMSSLSQSFCFENMSAPVQVQGSLETIDYATKISSLETEVEDLRDSRNTLEAALSKYEQECDKKDAEIKQLREKVFLSCLSAENESSIALTQSVAMPRTYGNTDTLSLVPTENQLLLSTEYSSVGSAGYRIPGNVLGGTMDRVKSKKLSGVQSKEQLQQELKSKEAMINIMKEKLERMRAQGSKEDACLEVERKELEDQVGGLDRKLSSMNTEEKDNDNEVDELREKLENVEKKAADFEEKNRYYQELLDKMNASEFKSTPRLSTVPQTASPINIPPPPPNLPPLPPPPLPEGLFGPATPQLVRQPLGQRSSQAMKADNRVEAMNELVSMLSSGKVHLKRARNKVPVPRDDPPPLTLPRAVLKRQVTAPAGHNNLLASYEAPSPLLSVSKQTPMSSETIDERLRLNKEQRVSSETGGGSELLMKLNRRYRTSEETTDFSANAQLPKIDSNPLPALSSESKPKPTTRRKVTPVPSVSPVLSRKKEDVVPIVEDEEPPPPPPLPAPPTDQSTSPVKQMASPTVSPNKPKLQSPLIRQISSDQVKPPLPPKIPIMPPTNRERVPITAKPKPEVKREKSGSNPVPIPAKPSKLMSIFRKEGKSNSTESPSPTQSQRYARAGTEGEIDSETEPADNPIQKAKTPQHFAN